MTPRILITPGEPAGIGPDVLLQLIQRPWKAELVAVADVNVLQKRAKELNLPLKCTEVAMNESPTTHCPGTLKIIPVTCKEVVVPGELNPANAVYVLKTLDTAIDLCLKKQALALVTGPVHKAIMNEAGIPFTGHTEYLAKRTQSQQPIMLFVVDKIKAALVTTHIPLSQVPQYITREKLVTFLTTLHLALQQQCHLSHPHISVLGLNPHAGENGHLGREEIDIITPTLEKLRAQGLNLAGPLPADTAFTPAILDKTDIVVGMYHDQVLPVIKHIGFEKAVNVTLGLPFLRTSVDHGTALSLAGTGMADAGSMIEATNLALAWTAKLN